MKLILFSITFLLLLKNLSAYEQISIQKTDYLKNYSNLIEHINVTISAHDQSQIIESNIYNINFSSNQISFELDISKLYSDLYESNKEYNLLLLQCSLKENFFQFNQNYKKCPNFKILSFNKDKFVYLNFLDNFYRIKKYTINDNPKDIWINMINLKKNYNELFIHPNLYTKLASYLGHKPQINSYQNGAVNVTFTSYFSNKQIYFLLNIF